MGDGFMNNSDLGEFGSHVACHFSDMPLGQLYLQFLFLFQQLLLLLAVKVSSLNPGHVCTVCLCCLLRGKEGVKAWMNPVGWHQASFHPTFPQPI